MTFGSRNEMQVLWVHEPSERWVCKQQLQTRRYCCVSPTVKRIKTIVNTYGGLDGFGDLTDISQNLKLADALFQPIYKMLAFIREQPSALVCQNCHAVVQPQYYLCSVMVAFEGFEISIKKRHCHPILAKTVRRLCRSLLENLEKIKQQLQCLKGEQCDMSYLFK